MSNSTLAWHFVGDTLRDGSPIPDNGAVLQHEGPLEMCASGLHASKRIRDALWYAPGGTICRVRLSGERLGDADKIVAAERKIIWRVNGEDLLREFARACALDVIDLWDAPDIVREFLETGNEELRAAAWDAAWAAAWDAARDAAWAAAWAASRDAAWAAAWDAAWAAARAVARDAARDAQNKRLTRMVMAAHKEQLK